MSSTALDAVSNTEIFRKNHPQIIAQKRELALIGGVRLKYNGSAYAAGTVLGRYDTGADEGLFDAYDDSATGASSGLATAACVLLEDAEPASGGTALSRAAFKGLLYKDKLTGLDANAITDLKARTIIASDGVSVLEF